MPDKSCNRQAGRATLNVLDTEQAALSFPSVSISCCISRLLRRAVDPMHASGPHALVWETPCQKLLESNLKKRTEEFSPCRFLPVGRNSFVLPWTIATQFMCLTGEGERNFQRAKVSQGSHHRWEPALFECKSCSTSKYGYVDPYSTLRSKDLDSKVFYMHNFCTCSSCLQVLG